MVLARVAQDLEAPESVVPAQAALEWVALAGLERAVAEQAALEAQALGPAVQEPVALEPEAPGQAALESVALVQPAQEPAAARREVLPVLLQEKVVLRALVSAAALGIALQKAPTSVISMSVVGFTASSARRNHIWPADRS